MRPAIEVVGVEAELYPSMKNVIENGHGAIGGDTLAEGIAVKEPGEFTSRVIAQKVDDILLVEEAEKVELSPQQGEVLERMAQRWIVGDPAEAGQQLERLVATYEVDEVMVHPVAGAHVGTEPGTAPARRRPSALAATSPLIPTAAPTIREPRASRAGR